jgi:hypothetical protein
LGTLQSGIRDFGSTLDLYGPEDQHEVGEAIIFMMVVGSQAENMEKSVE